jgi:hypothetical protein
LVTVTHIRAGRGFWGGISPNTCLTRWPIAANSEARRGEFGPHSTPETRTKLERALESANVEFIDENGAGPGVRLTKRFHDWRLAHTCHELLRNEPNQIARRKIVERSDGPDLSPGTKEMGRVHNPAWDADRNGVRRRSYAALSRPQPIGLKCHWGFSYWRMEVGTHVSPVNPRGAMKSRWTVGDG